ncbi:MAG TPA: lipoyl(octanoyl) transferase LipB, partial [Gammaproteobacteria bacterium]|nr:lipoyl(octanoyl) transferase LipB [Gammaproteobacteria bacterium]
MLCFREFETIQAYEPIHTQMRSFTTERTTNTPDEIWLLQHTPVFTQGQAGKAEHILNPGNIPVIQSDRGGQVTYHGPGQLMIYALLNLRRYGLSVRSCVTCLENIVITLLAQYSIPSYAKLDAPGIYCEKGKIGSIGLRIRKGFSYHGVALNVRMD